MEVREAKYSLTKEQRLYYSSVLLLEDMNNFNKNFPVLLEGQDKILEPIFIHMMSKDWIEISGVNYVVTDKGRDVLLNYLSRLTEFRSMFKVYSAVDTGEGEFGHEAYFDFDTDEQFMLHIEDDRFEDLRVAVCEMKDINPLDVIFLEFVDGGKFDFESNNTWQTDLVTGLIWGEMLEVANTNLHVNDLEEYDEDGNVTFTGEEVMTIIIKQGLDVMKDLMAKQAEIDAEEEEYEDEEEYDEVEEVVVTEYYVEEPYYDYGYYEVYYDPFYISPCWGVYYY